MSSAWKASQKGRMRMQMIRHNLKRCVCTCFRCFRMTPRRLVLLFVVVLLNVTIPILYSMQHLTLLSPKSPSDFMNIPPKKPVTPLDIFHAELQSVCSQIAKGSAINTTRLNELKNYTSSSASDALRRLRSLARNCPLLKQQHRFYRWPVTAEEEAFPLAFSFKLHKAPEMFERLLSVLWRPHNLYVVHVDSKASPEDFQLISSIAECFDNVVLTEKRVKVVYASILSLNADLECVRVALRSAVPWRYHLAVSGQEFPLRTNLEMVQILGLLNGTSDVENYPPPRLFIESLTFKSRIIKGETYLTAQKRAPFSHPEVVIRKGSAYNAVSREFLSWTMADPVSQDLLVWLNDTWAPDELFWSTVSYLPDAPGGVRADITHSAGTHLSSKNRQGSTFCDTKAVVWTWDPVPCHGVYVRHICVMAAADLPWLLSRPELIANKFNVTDDALVLHCLEQKLEEKARVGFREVQSATPSRGPHLVSTLNWTYYRSLPHLNFRRGGLN